MRKVVNIVKRSRNNYCRKALYDDILEKLRKIELSVYSPAFQLLKGTAHRLDSDKNIKLDSIDDIINRLLNLVESLENSESDLSPGIDVDEQTVGEFSDSECIEADEQQSISASE